MLKRILRSAVNNFGYEIERLPELQPDRDDRFAPAMEEQFRAMYWRCHRFTMTQVAPMYSLYKSVEYVVTHDIPGDVVECGVWRGGSSMLAALTLSEMDAKDRSIYLYDTYEGMAEPTEQDREIRSGRTAIELMSELRWVRSPLEEVERNLESTGYPTEKLEFVKGKVEDTIPNVIPDRISILRLDTDWFESTYHELTHLYPRLSSRGVLIIDDYGTWEGAKAATDRYFEENGIVMLLHPVDGQVRVGIKL